MGSPALSVHELESALRALVAAHPSLLESWAVWAAIHKGRCRRDPRLFWRSSSTENVAGAADPTCGR